jgi:dTDP-L-rhamnose 4-epimerase
MTPRSRLRGGTVLVTGGAGFIGSHLVDALVAGGRRVRVLDSMVDQVHGDSPGRFHNPAAEYVHGSVLAPGVVDDALRDVTDVVHLAAVVGVGQSMYEIAHYVRENCLGTALLLERIAARSQPLATLLLASSMSIYGEGQYECHHCGAKPAPAWRPRERLTARLWEPVCAHCGEEVQAVGTHESKPLEPRSVYAISKNDQEAMCLQFGRSYGGRTLAFRLFNVYGTRQSLSNPYTGVAAIFTSRLLNGSAPIIFEDGNQSRDFTHVSDVVRAFELGLDADDVGDRAMNVGTGRQTSVREVADLLRGRLGTDVEPEIANRFREGDVRHCFAEVSMIEEALGWRAETPAERGINDLVEWVMRDPPAAEDHTARATRELGERSLLV